MDTLTNKLHKILKNSKINTCKCYLYCMIQKTASRYYFKLFSLRYYVASTPSNMEFCFIFLTALLGAALTFFSGFGLGTLLLPVLKLFLPIEVTIAITSVVHFLNNIFKLSVTYKSIEKKIAWQCGPSAMLAAFADA